MISQWIIEQRRSVDEKPLIRQLKWVTFRILELAITSQEYFPELSEPISEELLNLMFAGTPERDAGSHHEEVGSAHQRTLSCV
jgi:hypothetical protein